MKQKTKNILRETMHWIFFIVCFIAIAVSPKWTLTFKVCFLGAIALLRLIVLFLYVKEKRELKNELKNEIKEEIKEDIENDIKKDMRIL